jgi:cysteine desulfurase
MTDFMSFDGNFGNPASRSHSFGWKADEAVEEARNNLATLICCDPREIIWTSGATESDNLAIKGAARFYKNKGNHLVTSKIEHKAVLDPFRQLEDEGFEVTYLEPNSSGEITVEQVAEAVTDKTILVSLMHMNNELGTITDIDSIGELTRSKGIIFHVDAAQSIGKISINMSSNKIDLLSVSAHKFYGPKGVGALFVRRKPKVRLEPLFHGGGHERGFRSGTLATHQIVGLGEAARIAHQQMNEDLKKLENLKRIFWEEVKDIEEIYVNGDSKSKFPGILNISFNFVEGESLIMALKSIAVSSGSACTSASLEPSYVLRALGRKDELAHSSIRFSFGRYTTEQDVKETALLVKSSVERLREISPLWEMYQDGVDLDKIEWA